ncbi:MAG TPA: hypothetical protein VGF56_07865 [Rhizomicrobium sp.]
MSIRRFLGRLFDPPVGFDDGLPCRRQRGASTPLPARGGLDQLLAEAFLKRLEQQPCPAIAHAHRARGGADRTGVSDLFQQANLTWADLSAGEIDADRQARMRVTVL